MLNFNEKITQLNEIRQELDDHIWGIFVEYINIQGINFNSPDYWEEDSKVIYFVGTDGCMGCYNNMSLSIPMTFFTDPDALNKLKQQIRDEKEAKARKLMEDNTAKERNEYIRLKKKFQAKPNIRVEEDE